MALTDFSRARCERPPLLFIVCWGAGGSLRDCVPAELSQLRQHGGVREEGAGGHMADHGDEARRYNGRREAGPP